MKKDDFVRIKNDTENAVYQIKSIGHTRCLKPFAALSNDELVPLDDLVLFEPKEDLN